MAQLVLTAASNAAARIGPALARTAASSIANFAANSVSTLIFGPKKRRVEGPRLESFQVQASTEGAPVLRVFGRARVAGQVIWASNFRETISETVEGGKGAPTTQTTTVSYLYSISLAIGLCEGEISGVGRIWADGKPFSLEGVNARIYHGTEDQQADGLITLLEGPGRAPAFRGLAYIVFEDLPLADFGNRIPQFSFEVERPLTGDGETLESLAGAVSLIPSSGEFVYGTTPVMRVLAPGYVEPDNVNNLRGTTDFVASLDQMQQSLPHVGHIALFVAWYGTDITAQTCRLVPGVENREKQTEPYSWAVSGETRESAHLISRIDGAPAYGGTPADGCVIEALRELKDRGLKTLFHPFILMDSPGFPWRGRINAAGADGTAAARDAVAAFFGTAVPADFTPMAEGVSFAGTQQSFRRFILHYAHLCKFALGDDLSTLDGFILGSELRGLTTIRDDTGAYPAVAALKALAADVRAVLGPTVALSYGADWSEYSGHQPEDGSGDRIFHLDPFWADHNVDFVGIDNYMPLSDWRPGQGHLDAQTHAGPYDADYLRTNVRGGEGYDWFYASFADRQSQNRSPISDGAHGEDWIFRVKDLWNWWAMPHHDRPGGVRAPVPTPWVPQSKPIRFTELGCPAVDNGAAQPNVFVDEKSTESALPYFSRGTRDDLAQRRFLEAQLGFWQQAENNPQSPVYNGPMVDPERIYVYAWDARPYPDFPARDDVWGDTQNWSRGHWLNGRTGKAPLGLLVEALSAEAGIGAGTGAVQTTGLDGLVTGYVVDRPLSPREMIEPLADVFQFDMVESAGQLRFQPRTAGLAAGEGQPVLSERDLVAPAPSEDIGETLGGAYQLTLSQPTDLPSTFRLGFFDEGNDYLPAIASAVDPGLRSAREDGGEIAAVLSDAEAAARARSVLADAWVMREQLRFSLPPSALAVEPGDIIHFRRDDGIFAYRITEIETGLARTVSATRLSPPVFESPSASGSFARQPKPVVPAALDWVVLDLPFLGLDGAPGADALAVWFAAFARPWPGTANLVSPSGAVVGQLGAPTLMGHLTTPLDPGPPGRWLDQAMTVRLTQNSLQSRDALSVFAGQNALAIILPDGTVEVAQFLNADLIGPDLWSLSRLLRGQAGTKTAAQSPVPVGSRVVFLTAGGPHPVPVPLDLNRLGTESQFQAGPATAPLTDSSYRSATVPIAGRRLRPLAPVHVRAHRVQTGFAINWIRRTRLGGDSWEGEDVPLGEAIERFRLTISRAGTVVRTVETDSPFYFYPQEDARQDAGVLESGADGSLTVQVAQASASVGFGAQSSPIALSVSGN